MKTDKSLVILGLDEQKKPHASRFDIVMVEAVRRAATLMGFRTAVARTAEARELANKLVDGRLFASGRGLVPFVKPAIYEALLQKLELEQPPKIEEQKPTLPSEKSVSPPPQAWLELKVGTKVLAPTPNPSEDGWWGALIIAVKGDQLTLRWIDTPKQKPVTFSRSAVAILPPSNGK